MRDASTLALAVADKLEADAVRTRARITDEAIGLFLWHWAGIRDEDELVALINRVRAIINGRARRPQLANDAAARAPRAPAPVQLSLALDLA